MRLETYTFGGDVVALPAGTGHCNVGSSGHLLAVGAYPNGMRWDLRRGDPAERDEVLANIARVPLPDQDPVEGAGGSSGGAARGNRGLKTKCLWWPGARGPTLSFDERPRTCAER
jgi:hypothetical protein